MEHETSRRSVARMMREHGVQLSGTRVLALCSGGPDSVVLVDVLCTLPAGSRPATVGVLFIDHGLRNVDADRAAAQAVAERHGSEFVERSVSPGTLRPGEGMQTRAREWRYRCAAREARNGRWQLLATGHHADDQLETMLYGMVASSGLRALAGMPLVRALDGHTRLVRPLLALDRMAVVRYAEERGLDYVDDPSNADERHARNRIRHTVVPALLAVHPGAGANLERTRQAAGDAADVIDELASVVAAAGAAPAAESGEPGDVAPLDSRVLVPLQAAAAAAVIAAWLRRAGVGRALSARNVDAILRLAQDRAGTVQLEGACVWIDRYYLRLRLEAVVAATREDQATHG